MDMDSFILLLFVTLQFELTTKLQTQLCLSRVQGVGVADG